MSSLKSTALTGEHSAQRNLSGRSLAHVKLTHASQVNAKNGNANLESLKAQNEAWTSKNGRGSSSPRLKVSANLNPIPEDSKTSKTNTHIAPTSSISPQDGASLLDSDSKKNRLEFCASESEKLGAEKMLTKNTASDAENILGDTRMEHEATSTRTSACIDDKSDGKDWKNDTSGDENYELVTIAPLSSFSVDVEDLYDCAPITGNRQSHCQQLREPKMFLPRMSNIELFHFVLTEDAEKLKQYLDETSPHEILSIVNATGCTLYHYGALSKNKTIKQMVFQHVNSYNDAQYQCELKTLMRNKSLLNARMQDSQEQSNSWVPPRAYEFQREMTKQKCADWTEICSKLDVNGRSIFHYLATTTSSIPVEDDYEFCSILRTHSTILSTRDTFKRLALHYAVEAENLKQVKWYFQKGVKLSQNDVDLLLSFDVSRVMEKIIFCGLEARHCYQNMDEQNDISDPSISAFALAKLHQLSDNRAGHLHQLPLHRAAKFGNIGAVKLLLKQGADPNARDTNLWTPLHYCADEATANHMAIARLLLESSISEDHLFTSLLSHNIENIIKLMHESPARLLFVTYLHENRADLNLMDHHRATPLLLACRGGDIGVTRFLLRAGCDPTLTGDNMCNPLHAAITRGHPSMVHFLLSWDADSRLWINLPDLQGRKPIYALNDDNIRQLLRNLWMESYYGNDNHVRQLLLTDSYSSAQAQSISITDKTAQIERTPLHLAILGYMDVLQSLEPTRVSPISKKKNVKQKKVSEMKQSASSRYLQTAMLLLQAGADLCAMDKWGITPLMLAATVKDTVFMSTFLDRVSEEDSLLVTDVNGNTALHYAYAFCQTNITLVLEDHMQVSTVENNQDKSPFEMTGYCYKIFPKEYREFQRQQLRFKKLLVK